MILRDKVLLLTGASAGIGRCLAVELAARGARLVLAGRSSEGLAATSRLLPPGCSRELIADLAELAALPDLATRAEAAFGQIDGLVNNAGFAPFRSFEAEDPASIELILRTNTIAPITLTRLLLPALRRRPEALIAFTGSVFGSIGFPYYASYSASKFALRGFAEALGRELHDSRIHILHAAPRATRTRLTEKLGDMAAATKMNIDPPELVARRIAAAIDADRKRITIGFPESLFVKINGAFPGLVDGALAEQAAKMKPFAT
ncbi:MAG: hypothetical protein RL095_1939 [Verrucomicrobiota bacterium]|jgi:short-subunit dehydrogenase